MNHFMTSFIAFVLAIATLLANTPVFATPQDRVATKARVEADLAKDLALPWEPQTRLEGRTCLDGRTVAGHTGDIVEYWANIECPYCDIQQVALAQRDNPEMCIVVRHSTGAGFSESVKKALSYEALREFSVNAANHFWLAVMPRTNIAIPAPYGSALQAALQEAAIEMEKFGDTVVNIAQARVSKDIVTANDYIFSTPTFVLDGLRFPACDFKAAEIPLALEKAKQARKGDKNALAKIIEIIVNGIMGDTAL